MRLGRPAVGWAATIQPRAPLDRAADSGYDRGRVLGRDRCPAIVTRASLALGTPFANDRGRRTLLDGLGFAPSAGTKEQNGTRAGRKTE
jgi:hypothetical protein